MNPLSGIYGGVARARREWYRQPHRQRRLDRPVISVGNLVVGGSGKTPAVADVARILRNQGERPAILSRGYGRRSRDPLLVVSDGFGHVASVGESGDEPQMLARALPAVPVIVGANRYDAGRRAETLHGATVHILDDGFQHLKLARDVDLLLVSAADLDERVLPAGRLREPLAAGAEADAVLVTGSAADRARVQSAFAGARVFEVVPVASALVRVGAPGEAVSPPASNRVVAVAGIARPQRFFDLLSQGGFVLADTLTFPDHHWFDRRDVGKIEGAARAAGVSMVVVTEKDAVRLEQQVSDRGGDERGVIWTYLPYSVRIEPATDFGVWLGERLAEARRRGATGST